MDLPKHYSLVKEHPKHFEVHDKRDGKTFQVAKKDVHPANQLKIMRLKKFSEGGEDMPDPSTPEYQQWLQRDQGPQADTRPGLGDAVSAVADAAFPQAQPGQKGFEAPEDPQVPIQVAQNGQPVTPQFDQTQAVQSASGTSPQGAMPGQIPGMPTLGGLHGIESKEAKSGMAIADTQVDQNTIMGYQYAKDLKQKQEMADAGRQRAFMNLQANQKLADEIANHKIDPNQYWEKGGQSKVGAAIGIILGGIGQGLMHSSSNLVMDQINKEIDRNIDSQKAELGKKENLLSAQLRIQGNMQGAEDAYRLQQSAIFQGQLVKTALQTGNPIIIERAKLAALERQRQDMPLASQLAQNQIQMEMRKSVLSKMQSGQPVDAVDLINGGIIKPGEAQKAIEEQGARNAKAAAHAQVDVLFDKMDKEQSSDNLLSYQSHLRNEALHSDLTNTVVGAAASHRLTPETVKKEIEPVMVGNLADPDTRKQMRQVLHNMVDKHADPTPILDHFLPAQPIARLMNDGNGRTALFDPSTRRFLGFQAQRPKGK